MGLDFVLRLLGMGTAISVTQKEIDAGIYGYGSYNNPVTLAMWNVFPGAKTCFMDASGSHAIVGSGFSEVVYQKVPRKVKRFLSAHQKGYRVRPFKFYLTT